MMTWITSGRSGQTIEHPLLVLGQCQKVNVAARHRW